MVLDPDTFACGYMISGGLAGGSMTASQMLSEYLSYVVEGIIGMVLEELLTTAILAMVPCGWVAIIQLIFVIAEIISLIQAVMQMVDLVRMYQETGDIYYLQEVAVQVAAFATLSIASKLFGDKLSKLKEKVVEAIDEAGLKGACFVAGTLIVATTGLVPIEAIAAGDMVQSFNSETQEVSQKEVEETFVRECSELVHIFVGDETITTTPEHPFYVPQKGFVKAIKLRAGDQLYTVNGEYVVVEQIQHEILESPVKVYNFRVADNHTYFVGEYGVGVHNTKDCVNTSDGSNEGGSTSPKGLIGHDFEDYLTKKIGGDGSFSVGGRDFDGGIGNRWWEAKSGQYWEKLENSSKMLAKFKSDMGDRLRIATENGATYELFSNTPIPSSIKQWLDKKGIAYTELLD